MADDYTPSDEQVEAEWTAFMSTPDPDNYWDGISEEEAQARWSRWLAAHDAQVRRDAARAALDGLIADAEADLHIGAIGGDEDRVMRARAVIAAAVDYRDDEYPEETT